MGTNGVQKGADSTEEKKDTNADQEPERKELHLLHGGEAAKQVCQVKAPPKFGRYEFTACRMIQILILYFKLKQYSSSCLC